jgi:hypothetical protein
VLQDHVDPLVLEVNKVLLDQQDHKALLVRAELKVLLVQQDHKAPLEQELQAPVDHKVLLGVRVPLGTPVMQELRVRPV